MKILLDECVDPRLQGGFPEDCETISTLDLSRGVSDEEWLEYAEENDFAAFVTVDTNLPHQQNLEALDVAVILFDVTPTTYEGMKPHLDSVNEVLAEAAEKNALVRVEEDIVVIEEEVQQH